MRTRAALAVDPIRQARLRRERRLLLAATMVFTVLAGMLLTTWVAVVLR